MSDKKLPPVLNTKGQAKDILARMRPAFREHVRPHTKDQEGERLGGGSILNARWEHRLSRDVDVYVQLSTTEDGRRLLDRAAAACGGYRIEHPQFRRIEFERNKDNHVDISFRGTDSGAGRAGRDPQQEVRTGADPNDERPRRSRNAYPGGQPNEGVRKRRRVTGGDGTRRDQLWMKRDGAVIDIEPERLKHRTIEVTPIDWRPLGRRR